MHEDNDDIAHSVLGPIDANESPDQCSSAKKSSGLKCIAKQVIDIIKSKPCMTYPQVAGIVVQFNLKNGSVNDSDGGLCSQSNQVEGESNWDESNLAASAKKKRCADGISASVEGLGPNEENPARRRGRQESNLRRRIYDAWNVLKAASIIVGRDDKHFYYNPNVLKDYEEMYSRLSEEEQLVIES